MIIHVFGSTASGAHPRAQRERYGLVSGQGEGLQGTGYAIPVKRRQALALPVQAIREAVERFLAFAEANPDWTFQLSRVGVGAGRSNYTDRTMAPLFVGAPPNVKFPTAFRREMEARAQELDVQAAEQDELAKVMHTTPLDGAESVLEIAGLANAYRDEAGRFRASGS